jgi:hypothetical protein
VLAGAALVLTLFRVIPLLLELEVLAVEVMVE